MSLVLHTPNRPFPLKPLVAAICMVCATGIQAAPRLDGALPGNVTVSSPATDLTVVTQTGSHAVLRWRDFSILRGETVRFDQDNANAVVLNQVTGNDPSAIFGNLIANGRVFLINPNGIVFGASAQVNVGGLVASTLRLKSGQSSDNEYEFEATNRSAEILNQGVIHGENLALIAPVIRNEGVLRTNSPDASIHLLAVDQVTLNTSGSDLVIGAIEGHEDALINQLGNLFAQGGKIVLIARSASNGASSVINTSGINEASSISIDGDLIRLSGRFNTGMSQARMQVTAETVSQADSAVAMPADALVTGGDVELNADRVELLREDNHFNGELFLSVQNTATINADSNLKLSGNAGELHVQSGRHQSAMRNIELGNLVTDNLAVRANQLTQAAGQGLTVNATTDINASDVMLINSGNRFDGAVNLSVSGNTRLVAHAGLRVSGVVNNATLEAESLQVAGANGLNVTGDLDMQGGSVLQTAALSVAGNASFSGSSIDLTDANNLFAGMVDVNVAGQATVYSRENLQIRGSASSLNAAAGDSLVASSMNAANIELSGASVQLNSLTASGNLTLNGGEVRQNADLTVAGITTLGAGDVLLQNAGNDFQDTVVLQSAGTVSLQDRNSVNIQGRAESLTVHADQRAQVHASGDMTVGGSASVFTAIGENELRLSSITADELVANARNINQASSGSTLQIAGDTLLTGRQVLLNGAQNSFQGAVGLNVNGQAEISARGNLEVLGHAQHLNANVERTLSFGDLNVDSAVVRANAVELNRLNVSDNATLQANRVTQTMANQSSGRITLAAETVDLRHEGNNFSGELNLQGVMTADIRSSNNLTVGGQANVLNATAAQRLAIQSLQADRLYAVATNISQIAGSQLRVREATALTGGEVQLRNAGNDFTGAVNLNGAGNVAVADANDLQVNGTANSLNLNVRNTLTLGQVTANSLNVSADDVAQNAAVLVRGNSLVQANTVALADPANDFQGQTALNVSGSTVLRDANILNVSGTLGGAAQFFARGIDQGSAASAALIANADLLLQAESIQLANQFNRFNQQVRIENANTAVIRSLDSLNIQGANIGSLNVQAQHLGFGQLGELAELSASAERITQNAALIVQGQSQFAGNRIELGNSGNDFQGNVVVHGLGASTPDVLIADRNSLNVQGDDLVLRAQVQNELTVQANNVVLNGGFVHGSANIDLTGELTQTGAVTLNNVMLKAEHIRMRNANNRFAGTTQLESENQIELSAEGNLTVGTANSTGALSLSIDGDVVVSGEQLEFSDTRIAGSLSASASQISQSGGMVVEGHAEFSALGGAVNLENAGNDFQHTASVNADQTRVFSRTDLRILNLQSRGGELSTDGRLVLLGQIEQGGGELNFAARGIPRPLSSAEIALLLPPSLDVFSTKDAANPITGMGRISLASASIEQVSGQIISSRHSRTQFNTSENGSVVLVKNNQINGQVGMTAGRSAGQAFDYQPRRGASLFAVNNDVKLNVGGSGIDADLVAIRARGLATQGPDSAIRARMPYNDIAAGTSRSYAGLTLSIPLSDSVGGRTRTSSFGESSASGQTGGAGAIRVEVGDDSRPGLGGYLTVLPFEGSNLLPGQVVYLSGPEKPGASAFFYDGARTLNRVPVVYNGSLLLSPQENAALTTAQGAVVLARQEQTRSVVRTENVVGKIIQGVVLEVGPGHPATEGEGGAGKPSSCEADGEGLNCAP